jgi:hypothetical protein
MNDPMLRIPTTFPLGGAGAITARRRRPTAGQQGGAGRPARARDPDPPDTMPPLVPNTGRPYNPVVTLNGWTCPGA